MQVERSGIWIARVKTEPEPAKLSLLTNADGRPHLDFGPPPSTRACAVAPPNSEIRILFWRFPSMMLVLFLLTDCFFTRFCSEEASIAILSLRLTVVCENNKKIHRRRRTMWSSDRSIATRQRERVAG